MNRIFRLKFKRQTRELVVVSEVTKGVSKENSSTATTSSTPSLLTRSLRAMTALIARGQLWVGALFGLGAAITSTHALALGDHNVVNGHATFDVNGVTTTIRTTPNTIINWKDFNINKNEIVNFIQANEKSSVLNRVLGGKATEILGSLKSNGRVFIINPNGIIFGHGSNVNVAGLVASTLNIKDKDFINGKYNFTGDKVKGKANPNALAQVLNQGLISVNGDGNLMLIGGQVINDGVLKTQNGSIYLLAGKSITIGDLNNPSINYVISAGSRAINLNQIFSGGKVNLVASQVENQGEIAAVSKNGQIQLFATSNKGTVRNTGKLKANNINIQGANIAIDAGSKVEAVSVADQAGHITVGADQTISPNWKSPKLNGDRLADLSDTTLTQVLTVSDSAEISADSTKAGKPNHFLADHGKWDTLGVASINMYGKSAYYGGSFTAQHGGVIRTAATGMAFGKKTSINTNNGLWLVDGQDISINSYNHNTDVQKLGRSTSIDTQLVSDSLAHGSVTIVSNAGNVNVQSAHINAKTTGDLSLIAKAGVVKVNSSDITLDAGNARLANGAATKINPYQGNLYLFGHDVVKVSDSHVNASVTTIWSQNGFVLTDNTITANQVIAKDNESQFSTGLSFYATQDISQALGTDLRSVGAYKTQNNLAGDVILDKNTFNVGSEVSINTNKDLTLGQTTINGVINDKNATAVSLNAKTIKQTDVIRLTDTAVSARIRDYTGKGTSYIFTNNAGIVGNGATSSYNIEVNRYAAPDTEGTNGPTSITTDKLAKLDISNVNFSASATYYDQNSQKAIDFSHSALNLDHATANLSVVTELSNSKINQAGKTLDSSIDLFDVNAKNNSNLTAKTSSEYYAYSAAAGKNSPQLIQVEGTVNAHGLSAANDSNIDLEASKHINVGALVNGGSLTLDNHSNIKLSSDAVAIESARVVGQNSGSSLEIDSYNSKAVNNNLHLSLANTTINADKADGLTLVLGNDKSNKEILGVVDFKNVSAKNLNLNVTNVKNINLGSSVADVQNHIDFVNVNASNSNLAFDSLQAKNINIANGSHFNGRLISTENLNVTNHSNLVVGNAITVGKVLNVKDSSLSAGAELNTNVANIDASTVDANEIKVVNLNVSNIAKVSAQDSLSVTNLKLDGANSVLAAGSLDASGNVTLANGSSIDISKIHAHNLDVINNNLHFADVKVDNALNVTDSSLVVDGDINAASATITKNSKVEARSLQAHSLSASDSNLKVKNITIESNIDFNQATVNSFGLSASKLQAHASDLDVGMTHIDNADLTDTNFVGNELAVNYGLSDVANAKGAKTQLKVGTISATKLDVDNIKINATHLKVSAANFDNSQVRASDFNSIFYVRSANSDVSFDSVTANATLVRAGTFNAKTFTAQDLTLDQAKANFATLHLKGDLSLANHGTVLTADNLEVHNLTLDNGANFTVNQGLTADQVKATNTSAHIAHANINNLSLINASLEASDVTARSHVTLTKDSRLDTHSIQATDVIVNQSQVSADLAITTTNFSTDSAKVEVNQINTENYNVFNNSLVFSNLTFAKQATIYDSAVRSSQNFVVKGNALVNNSNLDVAQGQAIFNSLDLVNSSFNVVEFDAYKQVALTNSSVVTTNASLGSLSLVNKSFFKSAEDVKIDANVDLDGSKFISKALKANNVDVANHSNLELAGDLTANNLTYSSVSRVNAQGVNVKVLTGSDHAFLDAANVLATDHITLEEASLNSTASVITKNGIDAVDSSLNASNAISSADLKAVRTDLNAKAVTVEHHTSLIDDSSVKANSLTTQTIDTEQSRVDLTGDLTVDSSLVTENNTNIKAQAVNVNGELVVRDNSRLDATNVRAVTVNTSFGGVLNASKVNTQSVEANTDATINVDQFNGVNNFSILYGSTVKTGKLNTKNLTIDSSTLRTADLTTDNLKATNANLDVASAVVKQSLVLANTTVAATGDFIAKTALNAQKAHLTVGGSLASNDITLTDSTVKANVVDATNSVTLDHSQVKANSLHASDLRTKGATLNVQGTVNVDHDFSASSQSTVNTNELNVKNNVDVTDATVTASQQVNAKDLALDNAALTTTNLDANNVKVVNHSDLTVSNTASVKSDLTVKNAKLAVANTVTAQDLSVAGKDASVTLGASTVAGGVNVDNQASVEVSDLAATNVRIDNATFKAHTVKANDLDLTDNSLVTVTKDLNVTDQVNVKSDATLSANTVNTDIFKQDKGVAQVNNLNAQNVIAENDSSLLVTNHLSTGILSADNSVVKSTAAQNHINDLTASDSQVTLTGTTYASNVDLKHSQLYGVDGDLVVAQTTALDQSSDLEVGSLHTNDLNVAGNSLVRSHNIYVNNNLTLVTADVKANTLTTSNIDGTIYSDNSSIVTSDDSKLVARNIKLNNTVFTSNAIYIQADTVSLEGNTRILADNFNADTREFNLEDEHAIHANAIFISCDVSNKIKCTPGEVLSNLKEGALSNALNNILHDTTSFGSDKAKASEASAVLGNKDTSASVLPKDVATTSTTSDATTPSKPRNSLFSDQAKAASVVDDALSSTASTDSKVDSTDSNDKSAKEDKKDNKTASKKSPDNNSKRDGSVDGNAILEASNVQRVRRNVVSQVAKETSTPITTVVEKQVATIDKATPPHVKAAINNLTTTGVAAAALPYGHSDANFKAVSRVNITNVFAKLHQQQKLAAQASLSSSAGVALAGINTANGGLVPPPAVDVADLVPADKVVSTGLTTKAAQVVAETAAPGFVTTHKANNAVSGNYNVNFGGSDLNCSPSSQQGVSATCVKAPTVDSSSEDSISKGLFYSPSGSIFK